MEKLSIAHIEAVAAAFGFNTDTAEIIYPYGEGHINDTIVVRAADGRRSIVQRINKTVFARPDEVMENIVLVTDWIRERIREEGGDPGRQTLTVLPNQDGGSYHLDGSGEYWRAYHFIEGTYTLQRSRSTQDFYCSARAFGQFQNWLADFPVGSLHETIAHFHDTPHRFRTFEQILAADPLGRAESVREEVDWVIRRREHCDLLTSQLESGRLPLRVTHNDTKLNNVLLDEETDEAICVIDLDTVMPGLVAYDFGDAIRFGASTALEDEQDLSLVHFSLELFEAYTRGYLEVCGTSLTPAEIDSLACGAWMMTYELVLRFLGDYINGDIYFKIARPGHNLDRARTQIKLCSEMEHAKEEMEAIVARHAAAVGQAV